jgi:dihydroorotase
MATTLLKNGTIVNEGRIFKGSILIDGEFIAEVFDHDDPYLVELESKTVADNTIDLNGVYVAPGLIDDHVHFREPGATHKATIATESAAAVLGGVTSYMDMPNNNPPATSLSALEDKFLTAKRDSLANYSFYFGADENNVDVFSRIDNTRVCGIKLFMGSSTGNMITDDPIALENIFLKCRTLLATHCEDAYLLYESLERAKAKYGEDIPFTRHTTVRPREACIKSTKLAIKLALAYKTKLHILHISTEEEVELIKNAKARGANITAEACPQYLFFDDSQYSKFGPLIKCNPSIKSHSDKLAIRKAIRDDIISVVGSDHAPHLLEEKRNKYLKSPSGIPLIQFELLIMLELVRRNLFKLEKVVEVTSHAPADLFQIDRRGYIRRGYYADIVIFDTALPSKPVIASKCGWSPIQEFNSTILHTFVNGVQVVKDSKLVPGVKAAKELRFNR